MKKYESPSLEIVKINIGDVITASIENDNNMTEKG